MIEHKAILGPTQTPPSLFDRVVHAVAIAYGITPSDVMSRRRFGDMANARHTIVYILHHYHGWNLSRIARHMCKDRDTIRHSLRKAPDYIETEYDFAHALQIALAVLKTGG